MFLVLFILLTLTCKLNYIGGVDRNELLQSFETKLLRTRPVAYMFSHFTHMVMIPIQNNKEIRRILEISSKAINDVGNDNDTREL